MIFEEVLIGDNVFELKTGKIFNVVTQEKCDKKNGFIGVETINNPLFYHLYGLIDRLEVEYDSTADNENKDENFNHISLNDCNFTDLGCLNEFLQSCNNIYFEEINENSEVKVFDFTKEKNSFIFLPSEMEEQLNDTFLHIIYSENCVEKETHNLNVIELSCFEKSYKGKKSFVILNHGNLDSNGLGFKENIFSIYVF